MKHIPFMMNKDRSKSIMKGQVQIVTRYMYNSMGISRRGRLMKEKMDKTQQDICTDGIQDSREHTEQEQTKYSMGIGTIKPLLSLSSS
jgi:hypothetical protein